jgi:hypothetical protein
LVFFLIVSSGDAFKFGYTRVIFSQKGVVNN